MHDSTKLPVNVSYNEEANASYIEFAEGPEHRTIPVKDGERYVAVLDFDPSGRLLGLELLGARHQLPTPMLDALTRLPNPDDA